MFKKIVSLITIVTFLVLNISCNYTARVHSGKAGKLRGRPVKIKKILKKSGEIVKFGDRYSWVGGNKIIGFAYVAGEEKEQLVSFVKSKRYNKKGKITTIVFIGGISVPVYSARVEGEKIIYKSLVLKEVTIPLDEVEILYVKKRNPAGILLLAIIATPVILLGGLILVFMVTSGGDSCPFIYSYDGEEYVFDAEPYGGSICNVLKRTEWCGLEHLNEVNGEYRLRIVNELDETQYTDEIKLVVVDHPEGTRVVPDVLGHIHSVSNPVAPARAYDGTGRDISHYVSETDWIYWTSRTDGRNPQKKEDLRDELVFEFPKPADAGKARLIFNGCNTMFGSYSLKMFLELYGNKVQDWYKEMNSYGPAFYRTWNLREELHTLWVRVETETGWKNKSMILGGGPYVSEDKLYTLDISDVPGDTLKIKLTPPAAFWKINYLAVDYGKNMPVKVSELAAAEAKDHKGQDVRQLLTKNDNRFLVMPEIGDSAELVFSAPPRESGMVRSYMLKAGGYYDIHLKEEGEPRHDILEKFDTIPGFAVQYALEKYFKMTHDRGADERK